MTTTPDQNQEMREDRLKGSKQQPYKTTRAAEMRRAEAYGSEGTKEIFQDHHNHSKMKNEQG